MNDFLSTKKCLICKGGKKNDCLHWHRDEDSGAIWVWCQGKCQRGYSIYEYTAKAGLSLSEFLKNEFHFEESAPNEVNRMDWPAWFLPMFDERSQKGVDYVNGRNLDPTMGDMYYDSDSEGIVFPYYFGSTFVGAQIRFIVPRTNQDGDIQKMDTLPGTRLGLLFYGYNQQNLSPNVKGLIVCEGAFNALSIGQSLSALYGGVTNNPWRCISTNGCKLTDHHADVLRGLKDQGKKIVLAYDFDDAGLKGTQKAIAQECITHVANTMDTSKDWNDLLGEMGTEGLGRFFLKGIKDVR